MRSPDVHKVVLRSIGLMETMTVRSSLPDGRRRSAVSEGGVVGSDPCLHGDQAGRERHHGARVVSGDRRHEGAERRLCRG